MKYFNNQRIFFFEQNLIILLLYPKETKVLEGLPKFHKKDTSKYRN